MAETLEAREAAARAKEAASRSSSISGQSAGATYWTAGGLTLTVSRGPKEAQAVESTAAITISPA